MKRYYFFDLDNTLTPSKSLIEPQHVPILKALCERTDVIVVSGHGEKDIKKHLTPALEGMYHILGQNGNRAVTKDGTVLWNHSLSDDQKIAILKFVDWAQEELRRTGVVVSVKDEADIVEDRDSQIAFSLIGHHLPKPEKDAFDPDFKKRRALYAEAEQKGELRKLADAGVEARIAGTTNIDLFQLGKNKGYNVGEFIKKMGWNAQDCIYIGDALFPGGNDDTVNGVIETHGVKDYKETFDFLNAILSTS